MRKKLIELYKEWMKTGFISENGLCLSIPDKYKKYLNLCHPTTMDIETLILNKKPVKFWGADEFDIDCKHFLTGFTPLRQTVVLLICAICDEI